MSAICTCTSFTVFQVVVNSDDAHPVTITQVQLIQCPSCLATVPDARAQLPRSTWELILGTSYLGDRCGDLVLSTQGINFAINPNLEI